MKYINKKILLIFFCFTFFFSCSNKKNELSFEKENTPPLEIIYKEAFNKFESGDWQNSIKLFQKIENKYSHTPWAARATLMIIYMYWDASKPIEALSYIEKFEKMYSTHPQIKYVEYMKALIAYEQINIVSKDQTNSELALRQFERIIKNYPNSAYAQDAKFKIDLIREQLAGKHMYLARYYVRKSLWTSAIIRLQIIIQKYQTTIYLEEALHRLVEIYYNLGNINEAKKYAAILGYNFNDSDWYKKSYKLVVDKNYIIKNQKQKKKFREKIISMFKFSK